jgi:hypothetical protein
MVRLPIHFHLKVLKLAYSDIKLKGETRKTALDRGVVRPPLRLPLSTPKM